MNITDIYTKIFPIGGVDDNNRYTELTGDKINCVQLVEPALAVSEFLLPEKDTTDANVPDKYAYRIPLISMDNYKINQTDITAFKLDYTGFLPTLSFEFVDSTNSMLSTHVPKDGSLIQVYIGGHGDELYYKPIRQDFVLTSIRKIAGGNQNIGGILKYRVYGKLNVPYGYRKEAWCSGESTAMQALFNIAIWTGLGFSTNFTNSNTLDSMCWRNNETGTYFDFMEDITAHACYSPNTFFTSFVDQYNVLNFVECHSLLSHGGSKEDVDLNFGRIQIKLGGGDAGHNGLKSLRAELGSGDFCRVRCGVGRPPVHGEHGEEVEPQPIFFERREEAGTDL